MREVIPVYMCQKVIIAIVMVAIVRAVGAWLYGEDGDLLCYVYMAYAFVVSATFTALTVYICKVLA